MWCAGGPQAMIANWGGHFRDGQTTSSLPFLVRPSTMGQIRYTHPGQWIQGHHLIRHARHFCYVLWCRTATHSSCRDPQYTVQHVGRLNPLGPIRRARPLPAVWAERRHRLRRDVLGKVSKRGRLGNGASQTDGPPPLARNSINQCDTAKRLARRWYPL